MTSGRRLLVVGLAVGAAGLVGSSATAFGDGSPSAEGTGASSLLGDPLVTSGSPVEGEELQAQEEAQKEAKRSTPEAVAEREASRTKFSGLSTEQAAKVAGEAFPAVVTSPAGGPPSLPAGESITGFPAVNVASTDLGEGKRGIVKSTAPMAIETSSGQRTPIDLSLAEAGSVFEPKTPAVGVSIPKRLSDGVRLPALDLSLTPVDGSGASLGGSEGAVDGASVFYANTETDTDTLVKPTTAGFATDTVLRSVESPQQLFFRVGLPEGASLVQSKAGSGPVEVVVEGAAVALIRPPSATDAVGTPVPVSMSVSGDVLQLVVASHSEEYQWPVSVDPEFYDKTIDETSNWVLEANSAKFHHEWASNGITVYSSGTPATGESALVGYATQGISKIYKVEAETYEIVDNGSAKLQLVHEGTVEAKELLAEGFDKEGNHSGKSKLCTNSECSASGVGAGNVAEYKLEAIGPEAYLYGELYNTYVYIEQEKGPEVGFNTTEEYPKDDKSRKNVLYGSSTWLSPYSSSVFEITAHDPGVGVSWARIYEPEASYYKELPFYKDGDCNGVQCEENYSAPITYTPGMADGEKTFKWEAEDEAGGYTYAERTIKVDSTPPHNLEITGWPKNREVSATQHTLTVSATDEGPGGGASSGVKSIAVSVDGGTETALLGASCPSGKCTASGKYTLDAEDLSEGVHRLVVVATDNANNVSPAKEFTFDVRHGAPVPVGPGTVDPTTGQFKLGATDVSLAGAGSVSRVYQSRGLTAGAEGPLGAQWAISLGAGQGITVLPNGSVTLTGAGGGRTTFTRNSKGEFESPLGDENLKVEAKEKEAGKGITEYLLKDSKAGTTTTFTQPAGIEGTSPVYTNQFGGEGAELKYPESEAVDSSGDIWVTDFSDDRIEKFSPAGALMGRYGSEGSGSGEFIGPWGIAINQSTGNVYVTDQGNNRVDEFNSNGEFVRAFGWGVSDGKSELETCTSFCQAGLAGSGGGEVYVEAGVAIDSSGDVWVADYGNNRVEEFNSEGKYVQAFGTKGKGEVQFEGPLNIAFSGGKLYVTDYGNNRVEELSTAGKYEGQFGKEGTGNSEFKQPRGIAADPKTGNLYVTDAGNNRVQEFSASRAFIEKFGSSGSGTGQFSEPTGVVVGSSGDVFVSDYKNHRIEEWTRPEWLPKYAENALKTTTAAYAYKPVEEEGKTLIEPTEVLAPAPAGVTCVNETGELEVKALKTGCRALTFEYAKTTGATGEKTTQWGTYTGHLAKVSLIAYNPATKTMPETPVAEYSYDSKGRLRAEWDPRISPALKTTYGYDTEGHVTSLTQAGQQPWALTYGTIASDPSTGRLLKVTQAHPKASWSEEEVKKKLGEQKELPTYSEAPKLSGSPGVGVKVGVSNGVWSDDPVAYSYQWEDCNLEGKACAVIAGASNPNYKPVESDGGHTLVAQVTATNGGGSAVATTAATFVKTVGTPVYSSAIKSWSPPETFEHPSFVAYGPERTVWVSDTGSNVVEKFNSEGLLLKHFTASKPKGLAVNASGDVWVVESGTSEVKEYSENGIYLGKHFGAKGTGAGQFTSPTGLVAGSEEHLWIVDSGDNRVEEFKEKGEFVTMFGFGVSNGEEKFQTCTATCRAGLAGSGAGQLKAPVGAAYYGGYLYVTDTGNNRVEVYSGTSYSKTFGKAGSEKDVEKAPQFSGPTGIAVVNTGLYTYVLVADTKNNRIQAVKLGTLTVGQEFGSKGSGNGQFDEPEGLAAIETGIEESEALVGDTGNNRLEVLRNESYEARYEYSSQFGMYGYDGNEFDYAHDVAINSKGDIWVLDSYKYCVDEFTEAGSFIRSIGKQGKGPGEFGVPTGIAIDSHGHLWVGDANLGRIEEFGENGEYLKEFGEWGSKPGQLEQPEEITVDSSGHIWVADSEALRVDEFNEEGKLLEEFGSEGKGKGQFSFPGPEGIAVDGHGHVWTVEASNDRVQEFTEKGEWLKEFGKKGEGNGEFTYPARIKFDAAGNLWVSDSGNDRIQIFNELGEYETQFGKYGHGTEQFAEPMGLAFDSKGDAWIADIGNKRVDKWTPGTPGTEGETEPPQPGTTIEYHVPVSGAGTDAPNLSKEEVEKWGQTKDQPVEGTAIFPPDEPQGWPASGYKRATIDYMDEDARTVNTATPSAPTDAIATSEYSEANEATRTLSADNRATAMKEECKSVTKKECKSAELAEKLDTKTEYNAFGSEILKTVGPEHKVKLSTGEEVQARPVTHDYYDEDAEQAEEKNNEEYNLLTKTTSGALLAGGEEKDVRTTVTSYNGQGDLGWKLRKATSTTVEPAGADLVHKTIYEEHENTKKEIESTGNVVETRAPAGNSEQVSPPSFSLHFGGAGSGNGQFKEPWADALDSSGNVWALDTGNDRVEKLSATGGFDAAYGKEGTGNLQFKEPKGIAINESRGNVYVADSANNRIEELSSAGVFVETIGWGVTDGKSELEVCKTSCKAGIAGSGEGQFSGPQGLTIDSENNVWVTDTGNNRVEGISEAGVFLTQFGTKGSGNGQFTEPAGIVISEGSFYVVDHGNDRVEQFSTLGAYVGQFGSKGSGPGQFNEPYGIAANQSTGVLYVCDTGNERMQELSPAGKFLTEWGTWGSTHEQSYPRGVAVGSTGDLYIIDHSANEVGEWIPPEAGGAHLSYSTQFGSKGTGNGQFNEPAYSAIDGQGNVWVTDYKNDRIEKFTADGTFSAAYGKEGSGEVQFNGPAGIAINKSTGNIYVADIWNNRVEELSSSGAYVASIGTSGSGKLKEPTGVAIDSSGNVWVADRGDDRIVEFSSTGTYIAAYGKEGTGELEFKSPVAIAFSGENVYVADSANHRIEELTNKGAYVRAWGLEGDGSGEFWTPEGIATDAAGNLYVVDINAGHIEEFSPTGAYKATFGSPGSGEGEFTHPEGDSIDAAGDLYVVDQGDNRVERWNSNEQAAHDMKTAYYSAKEESPVAACRNHPEWANLPCETEPAAQPDHGLPELPVSTVSSYNMWDEAEVTEEKFGTGSKAVVRKKTQTYDSAGRALTSEEKAEPATDTALPKVSNEYSAETGALLKQSTSEGAVTDKYNTLGQLIEYTDAAGNVTKYTYEEGGDGRLEAISEGKGEEAKSEQTYSYNATTGFMEKLVDTAAGMSLAQGTFTASYDVEGKMTSETYPNAMTATTTYNSVDQATGLVYEKTTDCASKCPETWFSDSVVPSIHGETLQQTSTLAKESYAYDHAGRLTETQETPAGKGCVVRLYGYDEEGNRTNETKREPGTEGKCATEGGTIERHTYDEANRLTDEKVVYETFGNITQMPSGDAGGHEIVSTYYVDNQIASQEQKKQLLDYKYDPSGRTLETASENKETKAKTTTISHYAGSGNALTWTSEGTEKWTRDIPGIDGALDAIQEAGKAPVLQLHDLQGNIVGTVEDNETVTKLASTYNSTEFGVPQPGTTPPKYAWLGAEGVSSEPSLGSGTSTEGGASYVPQVARNLQTAAIVPPGAFPNGPGTGSPRVATLPGWVKTMSAAESAKTIAEYLPRQEALEKEAQEKILKQCQEEGGCGAETGPGGDPKCYLQIDMGHTWSSTGVEWTYARAWGWCNNKPILGRESVLALCLGVSEENTGITESAGCMLKSQHGWSFNGSTPEPWATWQLYAHVHVQCESGIQYLGKAEFYAENGHGNSPITLETRPISCQGNRFEELAEGFQTIAEIPLDVQ